MPPPRARPIRILRIITRLNVGGPSIHAMLLTERLQDSAYESILVTGRPDAVEGDMGSRLEGKNIRRILIPELRRSLHPWLDLRAWWKIFRIIQQERPDIIHTHMAKAGSLGRTAAMIHRWLLHARSWMTGQPTQTCRIVHTFHGHVLDGYFSPWTSRLFVMIERWLAHRTDCLIAVSKAIQNELLSKGIGCPQQWQVILLGVDLSALAQLPPPRESSPVRFGMVGRLVPIKNPTLFLHAFEVMLRQRPNASIRGQIVGDGPLRPFLEQEVKRLGLETLIQFTGWQQNLCRVYEGLDITCLTSWNEGTPVALIEAMAAGRTVVATDVGGVRDLLAEGQPGDPIAYGTFQVVERGVLVRPGDMRGFAEALSVVACDQELRRKLSDAARSYVVQRFGAERLYRDMEALYAELL